MKKLILLLCIILSSNCAYVRHKYNKIENPNAIDEISQKELYDIIHSKLIYHKTLSGSSYYYLPTMDWIDKVAYPDFAKYLHKEHILYQERFDCKDFSRTFATIAQIEYIHTIKRENMNGLAIAEVWYFEGGNVKNGHAINLIITPDKEIVFFEPQDGSIVQLSDVELKSIYAIIF